MKKSITAAALVVTAAAASALPATASADPIVRCSASFLVGPVRCELADQEERIRSEYPVVDEVLTAVWPG